MQCGFEECTCPVEGTNTHCGPSCRLGIGTGPEPCKCGHSACTATEGDADPKRTRPGG